MANELGIAEGWLYQTLSGDATLRAQAPDGFWGGVRPRGAVSAFVVWDFQDSPDTTNLASVRLATSPLYLVRLIKLTESFADLQTGADRIDALLHRGSGTFNGVRIASCMREALYQFTELFNDSYYLHLGGYYRCYIEVP